MLRIRVPEQWRGDYLAALGAARIGERELLSLGKEIGWEVLEQFVESWFDYSEQRMISAIADLPPGRVDLPKRARRLSRARRTGGHRGVSGQGGGGRQDRANLRST